MPLEKGLKPTPTDWVSASLIQHAGDLVTDRVMPIFGCGIWLTGFRRVAVVPDALGRAPTPTGLPPSSGGWSEEGATRLYQSLAVAGLVNIRGAHFPCPACLQNLEG